MRKKLHTAIRQGSVAIVCLLLSAHSFGQGFSLSHIVCPASGSDLNHSDLAADEVWVSLLFNLDKEPTQGSGFIEGDVSMAGDQVFTCLGTSGHCLLIRIALRVHDVCDRFGYPESLKAKTSGDWAARISRNLVRPEDFFTIPIDVKLDYKNFRNSITVSGNHVLDKRSKHLFGTLVVHSPAANRQ